MFKLFCALLLICFIIYTTGEAHNKLREIDDDANDERHSNATDEIDDDANDERHSNAPDEIEDNANDEEFEELAVR